jgi:hypothetical protein
MQEYFENRTSDPYRSLSVAGRSVFTSPDISHTPSRGPRSRRDEMKEPDFDALRGREDVKKLVAKLEKKSEPKK